MLYVVIVSWLNERSTNANRGTNFSIYVMITLTVLAAGQMMFLLYDPFDMHLFAIASVLVSIAAIPVVLSTSPSPAYVGCVATRCACATLNADAVDRQCTAVGVVELRFGRRCGQRVGCCISVCRQRVVIVIR